jgi:hypothetical protein
MKIDLFGMTRRAQEGGGGSDRVSMQPEGRTLLSESMSVGKKGKILTPRGGGRE